jgi:hypothetical protein
MKTADVHYYVDADILGLAKVLTAVRSDVTYPGFPGGKMNGRMRPACPVTTTQTDDTVWIPEAAQRDWLIITRDSAIQERKAELNAVRDSGARMIALNGPDAIHTWDQLGIVIRRWTRIEAALATPGPFIYAVSKTSWRKVRLS